MGFLPFPPWIVVTGLVAGKYQLDGVMFRILNTICNTYNITLEAILGRDTRFGIIYPNGSCDGMLAQLLDNEIDLILGPWVLDERRIMPSKLSESSVFFTAEICLLASSRQSEPSSFFGFLYTFDGEIWFGLIGAFVSLIILSVVDDMFFEKRTSMTLRANATIFKEKSNRYFWIYLASLLSEGSARNPSSGRAKNLLALWLLSIMILTNAFTGQFKSILMVRSKTDVIETIQQLAQRKDVLVYMPEGTIFSEVFEHSPLKDYQKIYHNCLRKSEECIVTPNTYLSPKLYQNIKDGKGVGVADETILKFLLSVFCGKLTNERSLYFIKETFYPYNFVFVFQRSLPEKIINGINKRIQWLFESHIINKWVENAIREFEKCNFEEIQDNQETPLGMEHLLPLFLLQGFFLCFCTIVCILEKVTSRRQNNPVVNQITRRSKKRGKLL